MYDKAVDTYPSTIKLVADRFKTQEICDKTVDIILCLILFLINIYKPIGLLEVK